MGTDNMYQGPRQEAHSCWAFKPKKKKQSLFILLSKLCCNEWKIIEIIRTTFSLLVSLSPFIVPIKEFSMKSISMINGEAWENIYVEFDLLSDLQHFKLSQTMELKSHQDIQLILLYLSHKQLIKHGRLLINFSNLF